MPLLNPAAEVLQEAGVINMPAPKNGKSEKAAISNILNDKGLSREEIADQLKELARFSDKEEIRLRANELALKLHGELQNNSDRQIPNFTFVIQNHNGEVMQDARLNDILTPRT